MKKLTVRWRIQSRNEGFDYWNVSIGNRSPVSFAIVHENQSTERTESRLEGLFARLQARNAA